MRKKVHPKSWIVQKLARGGAVTSRNVANTLGISRQTAAFYLRTLLEEGKAEKEGSTKRSVYFKARQGRAKPTPRKFEAVRERKGLQEDKAFDEMAAYLNLQRQLSPKAYDITLYAFTEMVNNAIEHSKSKQVHLYASYESSYFQFQVRDSGIGVYQSIQQKFRLPDRYGAVEFLLKGKKTTIPERHSGEGIFFTSKVADSFRLRSEKIELLIDHEKEDQAVSELVRSIKGTEVLFRVKQKSRRDLQAIFKHYTNEEFRFDRTNVAVRLTRKEGGYVSRSEARRLLYGLENFNRIDLDFSDVPGIGQAFADEVFRVYLGRYPEKQIHVLKANPAVRFMIGRAQKAGHQ